MKILTLTKPVYDVKSGATTDEKIFINAELISEIVPKESVFGKKNDDFNTIVIMSNGNQYKVLEKYDRILELIAVA